MAEQRAGSLAEGTLVYAYSGSVVKPVAIETVAIEGEGWLLLSFDVKRKRVCAIQADNPRLVALEAPVVRVELSNGRVIRATADREFLTVDGPIAAKSLKKGALLVSMFAGFNPTGVTALVEPRWGNLTVESDPKPDGNAKVYDISTQTFNFVAEGAVVHGAS